MPFDEAGRRQIQDFQIIAAHVASHPRFRELVEELEESEELFNEAQKDPRKHLVSRGLELPEGCTVKLSHESPLTIIVCTDTACVTFSLSISLEVTT
jgi:hypothetical protein